MTRFKLATFAIGFGAVASGTLSAETVIFDDPNASYCPTEDISFGLGDYIIRADEIEASNGRLKTVVNDWTAQGGGNGFVSIEANKLSSKGLYNNIETSREQDISVQTEIFVSGEAQFFGSGVNLNLTKQSASRANLKDILSIKSKSLVVEGVSSGIGVKMGAEGGGAIHDSLLAFEAVADSIDITGGVMQAIYADGGGFQASDAEGTHVVLQAETVKLVGGGSYGGTYVNNIAVYSSQGASVVLSGKGSSPSLTVTAKQVNEPTEFGDMSLYSSDASIEVDYGDNSSLQFNGGLFAYGSPSEFAKINAKTGGSSRFQLEGNIISVWGDVSLDSCGVTKVIAPMVLSERGKISVDINADESQEESFFIGNLISAYGDDSSGSSRISLKLSGNQNVFIGTSSIQGSEQYNHIDVTLANGVRWDVEPIEGGNNFVTNLILDGGTVNLPYGQADGTYKQVDAGTLSGTGGTINFSLALGAGVEANDKLVVQRTAQGSHVVHVDVHQGFEPTDMSGYLIHADEDEGVAFTADDNKLEAGVYLYSYAVESKPGSEDGQKEWFISFEEYVEPPAEEPAPETPEKPGEPVFSPTGEAVVAMAGMGAQNAMYLSQLSDLRKRLGEIRSSIREGLWASVAGQKDRISGFSGTGFKQKAYRFNFGYDRSVGAWLLGANIKTMTADQETKDTNFLADGDAHSEGVNIYASYSPKNGSYADFVLSIDRYHLTFDTRMLNGVPVTGDYHNWGFGLSAELGHQFKFSREWFVEPQAQLSYYRLEGDEFRLSNGMTVEQADFDGLTARLGLISGKTFFKPDGGYRGQIYSRFGIKHELLGDQSINVNGIRFDDDLLGTRVYYGLGMDWFLTPKMKFFGHLERENGSNYTKEFDFNIGIKYCF